MKQQNYIDFDHISIYDRYPVLSSLCFDWEMKTDILKWLQLASEYLWISYVVVIVYVISIFLIKHLMKKRTPFNLLYQLASWNFLLFLFSFWCFLRLSIWGVDMIFLNGLSYPLCAGYYDLTFIGPQAIWAVIFCVPSKFIELGDSFFIVLRKKPLTFLHWYHHVTVLLYCYRAMAHWIGMGSIFIIMNSFVHTVMYFYYFIANLSRIRNKKPPKWGFFVTIIQISQMFLGMGIILLQFYYSKTKDYCHIDLDDWIFGFLMYTSYFALFIWFFLKRYYIDVKKPTKETIKKMK